MKIRAVVIDDESAFIETLKTMLSSREHIELVGSGRTVREGVELIDNLQPDLVFLDIKLDHGTGFDVLKRVQFRDFKTIFITAHDQHAIQAFKFSASDYLLKPVISQDLWDAIARIRKEIELESNHLSMRVLFDNLGINGQDKKKLVLKEREVIHVVKLGDILYCSAEGSYTMFYLESGEKIMVSQHLKEYEEILEKNGFFRAHRSHLVNIDKIVKYDRSNGGVVHLEGGMELPVAVRKKEKMLKLLDNI